MKKVLLLLCIALLGVSCKPWDFPGTRRSWLIDNHTDQTLILKCPFTESLFDDGPYEYREFELLPNSTITITVCSGRSKATLSYDFYYRTSAEKFGENVSWQILSEDGEVLKTWMYSDKDLADQRFFDESSWDYHENWEFIVSESWKFTILPEDLQQAE